MTVLSRQSEPYSKFGNIAAEGVSRLLGAPKIDPLSLVVRETVQNSWDARVAGRCPRYEFRLRELTPDQISVLDTCVFADMDGYDPWADRLRTFLNSEEPTVIEISDFGTSGLAGPSQINDRMVGEPTDFLDFMRNVGTPRDTELGGGTYGYGKSSLFNISDCGTIIVHTVTRHRRNSVRRLMACQIGRRYEKVDGGDRLTQFTGRHWWGVASDDEELSPAEGNLAAELSSRLGFAERDDNDFGTSILVLAPRLDTDSTELAAMMVREVLLWYFWPKMVCEDDSDRPPMEFGVFHNGDTVEIPDINHHAPLHLYAEALRSARRGDPDIAQEIWSRRPLKLLGYLVIERGLKAPRALPRLEGSPTPTTSSHIALLRPAELVIRYEEGIPIADEKFEWGGVFICSSEDEVEQAFADSEPPAHDDWNPEYLPPRSREKTFVRVALREIRSAMREFSPPVLPPGQGHSDGDSLGNAAQIMGGVIRGLRGDAPGRRGTRGGKGGGRKAVRISRPVFEAHRVVDGHPCAVFRIELTGHSENPVAIRAEPKILADGSSVEDTAPNGKSPRLLRWEDDSGATIGAGSSCSVPAACSGAVKALVSIPDYVAVTLKAKLEEPAV